MRDTAGLLVQSAPLFSHDSKRVMACCEGRVKIFDAVTGQLVSLLVPSPGIKGVLTAIMLDPVMPDERLIGTTDAGEILGIPIKVEGGEWSLLSKVDRGIKSLSPTGFALSADAMKLYQISIDSGSGRVKSFPIVKGSKEISSFAGNGSSFFAYASGKRVWLWSCLADVNRKAVETVEVDHVITCLTWSGPNDLVIAYSNGQMSVVRGISTGQFSACLSRQSQRLHWHSNAVLSMAGSLHDGHVVTGGHEAVAVLWNLGFVSGGTKPQFLPRLGAPIRFISVNSDGSRWALGMEDNAVLIVSSATFSVTCEIRGLALAAFGKENKNHRLPIFIHQSPLDPGHVLVPAPTGSLQLFDAVNDANAGLLHVTQENRISSLPEHASIKHREVRLVALLGVDLMATYDSRSETGEAASLRLWKNVSGAYEQLAVFDDPHGPNVPITAIEFRPASAGEIELISADAEGMVRLWKHSADGHWSKSPKLRLGLQKISSISISQDGSLIAMSSGPSVILVNGHTMEYIRSLTNSTSGAALTRVCLLSDESGLLVVYDDTQLSVWNLETLQLEWSIDVPVRSFAQSTGIRFAISTGSASNPSDSYTILFRGDSAIPLMVRRHQSCTINGLVFIQAKRRSTKTKSKTVLMALTSKGSIRQAFPEEEPVDDPAILSALQQTSLAKLVEEADLASASLSEPMVSNNVVPQWDLPAVKKSDLLLTDLPSHAMPSMRLLYASFMKLRLK